MLKFHLISIINLLRIYFIILISIITKKKIILFYHSQKRTVLTHTFYIERIFKNFPKEYRIIYAFNSNISLGYEYFQLKEKYLNFIFGLNFFISNNISYTLPQNGNKIYIHHNLYDDPWVNKSNEKKICKSLLKYDYIFVGTQISLNQLNNTFKKYSLENIPTILDMGYPRLDYLILNNKVNEKNKDSILIAPTAIDGFPKLTMIYKLEKIIKKLSKLNLKIILRPHPRDRKNKIYLRLKDKFSKNKLFIYDQSDDYSKIYKKAKLMITDISGTAYTFAFYTLSPVIFISINENEIKKNYSKYNFYLDRGKIGKICYNENMINQFTNIVIKNKNTYKKNIIKLRKRVKYLKKSRLKIKSFILNH